MPAPAQDSIGIEIGDATVTASDDAGVIEVEAARGRTAATIGVGDVNLVETSGGETTSVVSTGTESGNAIDANLTSGETGARAAVTCTNAGAGLREIRVAASVGACAETKGSVPAAETEASSGGTMLEALVGCIDVAGASGDLTGGASVGVCGGGSGPSGAAALRGSTGDTEAEGEAGCVRVGGSSGDTGAVASGGSCAGAVGGGDGGDAGIPDGGGGAVESEGGGSGVGGAFASRGDRIAALRELGQGTLPFTGMPLCALALAGLAAVLVGGALYRRRDMPA
ncbi:MAG TPA: hypothetical protein VHF23_09280 [Gaiellaceae bacterium]|nr:hypothetical protein [Gaiellaceae bacterium]